MEKSTRISEVLLAVLRPSQVLVGTVMAVGTVTLVQLLVLATPLAVAVRVSDKIGIPSAAAGDIGLAVAWFILGFGLYAFLFAAAAALVNKITEVSSAILPVTMTLIAGYVLAVTVVASDPNGEWSLAASMFPLTAPLAMPIRWASGNVPLYQLLFAMALTTAAAVLFVWVASSIYRRALLHRSPGEVARADQRADRLLSQEPQERSIGWRRIVRSFSGADVRGSPR